MKCLAPNSSSNLERILASEAAAQISLDLPPHGRPHAEGTAGGDGKTAGLADASPRGNHDAAGAPGITILIADDEAWIRTLVGEVLLSHGYNVLQAADGVEALDLAGQHPGPIHLLLTDLSMPRLDGRELHRRMRSVRPETVTLFMSGDLDPALPEDAAFLPKPFASSALVRMIDEVFDVTAGSVNSGGASDHSGASQAPSPRWERKSNHQLQAAAPPREA
jgi:CheY-like chemotaxis protein